MSPWNAWKISERSCGHVKNTPGNFQENGFWFDSKMMIFFFWCRQLSQFGFLNLLGFHHTMDRIGNMACLFVVLSLGPKRAMTCSHHPLIEEEWKDEKQKEIKKLNES